MEPTQGAMLLTSPVRRLAVDVLTERGALTAAELATALDLHVTTMRFHLDQLNGAGIVTSEFIKQPGAGRPKKVYSVAPGSFDTHRDQEALGTLTALLAETLTLAHDKGVTIRPDEAGRRWARRNVAQDSTTPASSAGAWLAKIGHMIDVLQEWGHTPYVRTQDGVRTDVIDLVHCPFLELAHSNTAVVCGIHRGLIAGSMEQLGEHETAVSLEPFLQPHLCRAHVTTRTPFGARLEPKEDQ